MGTNTVLPTVCFNECSNCALPAFADVTFRVNMSSQTISPLGVFLAGSFNGFSATADSMIAIGGGVYELTKNLDTTLTVQYKFVNGSIYEAGKVACGVADGLGGYNRVYSVMGTNAVLATVCFDECTNCITVGVLNSTKTNFNISPIPAQNFVNVTLNNSSLLPFEIIDQMGALISRGTLNANNNSIDISALAQGVYFIKVPSENGLIVKRFIKQ
jgi:hypothetical protein